jgi:uncharacterized protein (TIGR03000 family)
LAAIRANDWQDHIHIGPPSDPDLWPNSPSRRGRSYNVTFPPDYGPYPDSSYHWPTLREALDRYGWFGRRARTHCPTYVSPQTVVPPPVVVPGPGAALPPPELLGAPTPAGVAVIEVKVPADAAIWIDGRTTRQAGTVRRFETPPLEGNAKGVYVIRAQWARQGKEVIRTRQVRVAPGARLTVDFLAAEVAKNR